MTKHYDMTPRHVWVDGINKGAVWKKSGHWWWQRDEISVEPFAKNSSLRDVAEWARKCCNGTSATVRRSTPERTRAANER